MRFKTVYIEITNRCNLNCSSCYNRSGLNRVTREISVSGIRDIINTCAKYGAKRFLFSGGEPSLHSDFYGILRLLDEYPDFSFGFVTNGTIHDRVWIDFLNTREKITVQVSIDGASEETNRLTRGDGNFAKAIEFVKQLHLRSSKPLMKMVVSQNSIRDTEDYYRLAVALGCVPEFAFIYRSGNGAECWEQKALTPQQKLSVLRLVRRLNSEYGIEAYLPMCTVRCPYSAGSDQMSVCIKTTGMIQPCQTMYQDEYSIGNIFDLNEEVLYERVEKILSLAKMRTEQDFKCEKCLLRAGCGKGCMAAALNNTGDPLENDGDCDFRKLQFLDLYVKK